MASKQLTSPKGALERHWMFFGKLGKRYAPVIPFCYFEVHVEYVSPDSEVNILYKYIFIKIMKKKKKNKQKVDVFWKRYAPVIPFLTFLPSLFLFLFSFSFYFSFSFSFSPPFSSLLLVLLTPTTLPM